MLPPMGVFTFVEVVGAVAVGGGGGAPKNSPDMGYTKYICDLKKTQRTSAKGGLRRNIPINGDSQQK